MCTFKLTSRLSNAGTAQSTPRFDPPYSKQTLPFGVNDQGWVVGRFFRHEREHGFLFRLGTNRFLVFDYPGAAFTSLNGINFGNTILAIRHRTGAYLDAHLNGTYFIGGHSH